MSKEYLQLIIQVTIFSLHKKPLHKYIPLFQGSPHQSFSQTKNTTECMNNLNCPTVLSDWISNCSRQDPQVPLLLTWKLYFSVADKCLYFYFHKRQLPSPIIKFKVIFTTFIFSSWSYWQSWIYLLEFRRQIFSDLLCCALKTHGTQN